VKHRSQPEELSATRAGRLFARALVLRCPNCGSGGIFKSFLHLKDSCPRCGMRMERGEHDYFLGAYLFNLVAVELLLAGVFVAVLIATWPDPPWDAIQYGGLVLMLLGAVLCYPFAKTTWLAFDLMLRPMTEEELAAHREGRPPPPH
jgi:uncharacterized protein (DUF983 family)